MSLWQFQAAIGGVIAANGGEETLNREDAERLGELLNKVR